MPRALFFSLLLTGPVAAADPIIPPDAKLRIEQAINEAVTTTLARHDAGPVTITPLSQIRSFGAGLGGATAGMIARIEKTR